jgi:hypothetical protein
VERGGSLSFLVGTVSNVLVMEIGWTDVYILVIYFKLIFLLNKIKQEETVLDGINRLSLFLSFISFILGNKDI